MANPMLTPVQAAALKAAPMLPYSIASKELPINVVPGNPLAGGYNTGRPSIASTEAGNAFAPITVENQQTWTNPDNTPQLLDHEMRHQVQNNWAPKILQSLPPVNPNNPYDFGGTAGLKKIGGDPLKLSVEQQAAVGQEMQAMRQRGETIDPIYNTFDQKFGQVPLSVMQPTNPNQKGINTMPRTPGLPSTQVWGMGKLLHANKISPVPPGSGSVKIDMSTYQPATQPGGNVKIDMSTYQPMNDGGVSDRPGVPSAPLPAGLQGAPTPTEAAAASPAPHFGSSFGDTVGTVGTHLANMVTGPFRAFTAPPQNDVEMGISGAPGGAASLGLYRATMEPTVQGIQKGNAALKQGDTLGAVNSYEDAIPVVGPWARNIENDVQNKGAVAGLFGLGTDIAGPKVAGEIAAPLTRGLGRVSQIASADKASRNLAATRFLAKGAPGDLLESALKPGVKYGANVGDRLESTLPDILKASPNLQGVSGFAKAADSAADARGSQYDQWLDPIKNEPVDLTPAVRAQIGSVPLLAKTEQPGIMASTKAVASRYIPKPASTETITSPLVDEFNRPITRDVTTPAEPPKTLGFADQIRKDSNQKLHSFYNKAEGDRYAALANPAAARTLALNNEVRNATYRGISGKTGIPEEDIRANQDMHGNLIDAADIANKREPVFARHDPVTLAQKIAVSGGSNPISSAINYIAQKKLGSLTNSDALVNSAIDRFRNPMETPLQARPGIAPMAGMIAGNVARHAINPPLPLNPLFLGNSQLYQKKR